MNEFSNYYNKTTWDAMSQDQLLMKWQQLKDDAERTKSAEMEMRKYIVSRAFPNKQEGTNTQELGNNYKLKAAIKYNYTLADNDAVEAALDRISKIGNDGSFVADRLVSWRPNFLLTEYRNLQEQAESGSTSAKAILKEINAVLTISEAAPTLTIVEPKNKK